MTLHQTQKIIAKDRHRFRVLCCGRRWGKTTLAVEEIKGKAIVKPNKICYIAPTYQQARDIAWQMLLKELEPVILKVNESRLELTTNTLKGGESLIQLKGWESIESIKGQSFDFLVPDEIAMYRTFWTEWEEYIRPTLIDRKGEALFLSTPKGFNHFYELYNLQDIDSDFKSFHFTSYDNPFIPVEELEKTKTQMTEDRFAQEIMGDFRKIEGLVYKEFDRNIHLYSDQQLEDTGVKFDQIIEGIDFGYTNPAVILKIGVDYDNNFWVDEEVYKKELTDEQIAEQAAYFKPNIVYPDPEAPEKIQKLRNKGLNVRDVNKGKDSIRTGIDVVRELFKQGKIRINKRCVNLIWELETYHYPDRKPNQNEYENPVKENDHAVDALRYALMTFTPSNPQVSAFEQLEVLKNRNKIKSFR